MATINLMYSPHLKRTIDLVSGATENRARKWVVLRARDGAISLLHSVWKKKEGDREETPVIIGEYEIGKSHADEDLSVVLSPSVLSHIKDDLRTHDGLVLKVNDDEITVSTEDGLEFTKTRKEEDMPPFSMEAPQSSVGTYSSSQLGKAMEAVAYAAGIIPEASNSTAFIKRDNALELLAGTTTRRAYVRITGFHDYADELSALCPSFFARNLVGFFKEIEEEVEMARGEDTMILRGAQFRLEIHPFADFHLRPAEHVSSDDEVLYRLKGDSISMLSAMTALVSGYEKESSIEIASDKQAMVVCNQFSDGVEFNFKIPVENVSGANGRVVEIKADDLKRAFKSTSIRNAKREPIYIHTNGHHSVSMRRVGDANFSFEMAQLDRRQYALRDRIKVYGATSPDPKLISSTVCRNILLSHYTLPKKYKKAPELFSDFLRECGMIDEKGRCLKNIMIDNGAFSSRKDGKDVDEEAFFAFIEANEPYLAQYTMNDFYYSTFEDNLRSYERMGERGLSGIFIIHMGEPFSAIKKLFTGEYGFTPKHFGWGGAAVDTPEKRMEYVARAIALLPDPDAVKIHGFGMVSQLDLLQSFPFDSGDASTYAVWSTHRQLPTPWGLMSLRPDASDYVLKHPLRDEIVAWVESLSYEEPVPMRFLVDKLSEESKEGLRQRQLFGLAYYDFLEEGFKYVGHMEEQLRFLEWSELKKLEPKVKSVAFPAVESMNPIEIAA